MPKDPFHTFKGLERDLQSFLAAYAVDRVMIPPDEAIRKFIQRDQRTCRFCGKHHDASIFQKDAHVIPHFMGNKYLVSNFECDDCNSSFSAYENDLANWLGIARSVMDIGEGKATPTFKSPKEKVVARQVDLQGNNVTKISTPVADKNVINVDTKAGRTVITYEKLPYTPIKVYKALLKMGLCMLDDEETKSYKPAFDFLLSSVENSTFQVFAKVICHLLPNSFRFPNPFGMLYVRKDADAKLPKHVFMLYWEHYIFGFPLPFDNTDILAGHYKNYGIGIIFPQPVLIEVPAENDVLRNRIVDFSRYEVIKYEQGEMVFETQPGSFDNLSKFDPKTGEYKKGNLTNEEIVAIYLGREGMTIDTSKIYPGPLDKPKK